MYEPNFSSLASLEVPEKFVCGGVVVVVVGSNWLLCLTSTLVTMSCFELSFVELGLGYENKNADQQINLSKAS